MELSDIYKDASAVLISSEFSWFKDEYLTIFQDRPDISLFFKDCNIYIKYQHGDAQTIQKSPFDIIEEFNRKGYYAVGYISYDYLDNTDVNVKLRV
ncbi:MAG: hypothetical protein GTN99_07245, partial [Candidatus Dadabacteria bacterium]|nr:hypothetical protein [Candidatus Dadabacteria bacterium]